MQRRFVPQYGSEKFGLAVYRRGELVDADALPVVEVYDLDDVLIQTLVPTLDSTGLYSVYLDGLSTERKGDLDLVWDFVVGGIQAFFSERVIVTDQMNYWSALSDSEKELVVSVYNKVADSFDSTYGGPYLFEVTGIKRNVYETIASLMSNDAMSYINFTFPPMFKPPFMVGVRPGSGDREFPTSHYGLLEKATYIEFLKHLSRNYIEQPDYPGVTEARTDRRNYRREWKQEAQDEQQTLDKMLKIWKRTFLSRSRAMLVGGGTFPRAYANLGRPHWIYRGVRF